MISPNTFIVVEETLEPSTTNLFLPGDNKDDKADGNVGTKDANPNLLAEWLQEGKETRALKSSVGFLD